MFIMLEVVPRVSTATKEQKEASTCEVYTRDCQVYRDLGT